MTDVYDNKPLYLQLIREPEEHVGLTPSQILLQKAKQLSVDGEYTVEGYCRL